MRFLLGVLAGLLLPFVWQRFRDDVRSALPFDGWLGKPARKPIVEWELHDGVGSWKGRGTLERMNRRAT